MICWFLGSLTGSFYPLPINASSYGYRTLYEEARKDANSYFDLAMGCEDRFQQAIELGRQSDHELRECRQACPSPHTQGAPHDHF